MPLTRRFTTSPHAVARELGDEIVILDLASGTYFGLDPIGARVWLAIEAGRPLVEACDAIGEEYDVAREELERDVLDLVQDLEARRLVIAA